MRSPSKDDVGGVDIDVAWDIGLLHRREFDPTKCHEIYSFIFGDDVVPSEELYCCRGADYEIETVARVLRVRDGVFQGCGTSKLHPSDRQLGMMSVETIQIRCVGELKIADDIRRVNVLHDEMNEGRDAANVKHVGEVRSQTEEFLGGLLSIRCVTNIVREPNFVAGNPKSTAENVVDRLHGGFEADDIFVVIVIEMLKLQSERVSQ